MTESSKDGDLEKSWQIYSELGGYERHFNNLQNSYRNLASTWLLAVFAGIGFMLVQDFNITLPIELFISAIALIGSLGIYLLWNLDHMVCQRLLEAIFIEGYKMENNLNWLPKVRKNMIHMMGGTAKDAPDRAFLFYLVPQIIFFIVFILSLSSWITKYVPVLCLAPSLLLSITFFYAIGYDMNRNRLKTKKLADELLNEWLMVQEPTTTTLGGWTQAR